MEIIDALVKALRNRYIFPDVADKVAQMLEEHQAHGDYNSISRAVDKPVYILTAHRTFSGAEAFAYDMQAQKRATIVGEVTGGGANPTGPVPIGDHFIAMIPNGYALNPITKTNWEGVGIKPDIEVPAADALKVAHKTALEHLIAKTTDEQELAGLKQALGNVEAQQAAR